MLAYKRDVWLNNMMIMIVRQKNESVGQGWGRVQGGARAAFATLSWGPARMAYFLHFKTVFWR